jgi:hypothetical protein
MSQIEVDPTVMNQVFREKLWAALDENILLTAALTQSQNQLDAANNTIKVQQDELDRVSLPMKDIPAQKK